MSELRDKITKIVHQEILDGVVHGRKFAGQDIDYPVDARTHFAVNELEQLVNQEVVKALDSITRPEVFATTALVDKKGKTVSPISAYKMGVNDTAKEVAKVRATYTQDTSK